MNELARLVSFSFYLSDGGFPRHYRIVDRNGNPWFVVRDICRILGIKNPSDAIKNFPPEYVSTIFTIEKSYSEGGRVHKLLKLKGYLVTPKITNHFERRQGY